MAYEPRSNSRRLLRALALVMSLAAGCDESLPPRLPDPNPLSIDVKIVSGLVAVNNGSVGGNGGMIEVRVENVYTEVLQETAAVNIRCRIWLSSVPDSVGIATLDASSLTDPRLIQDGQLTLLPHTIALFDKPWTYTTTGGTPFWNLIPLKNMVDMQGPYKLSDPVEVIMTDTVRIFKQLPDYTFGPRSCTLQFEIR